MSIFEVRVIELNELQNYGFIQFFRVEILDVQGYGPTFFGRVRYALNGVEQEESLPMDLSKGIFIATLRDDQLGDIPREKLEKTLQEAAAEIIKIVRHDPSMRKLLAGYDYLAYDEVGPAKKPDKISENNLQSILKDYPYLKYDKRYSKPPEVLKCRVINPKSPRQAEDIFEIARRLNVATNKDYKVFYGGNSSNDANFDKVWTWFSLRELNFQKVRSGEK